MPLRWLEDAATSAATNMARDEALLLGRTDSLRFYAWRPHAVSLGWFQRLRDFTDVPDSIPIVRRATGGGAIHHAEELTFSLAVDAARLPADVDLGYAVLHDAVLAALAQVGVHARRLTEGPAAAARAHHRWCFAVPGRNDLVDAAGAKLCGSAQRRVHTPNGPRVLHHGSLVLERPSLTPFVGAVADQCDPRRVPELRGALAEALARALRSPLQRSEWSDEELAVAHRIETERYGNPAHTSAR